MSDFIDRAMRFSAWIIMVVSLIAYFAYQVLDFRGSIETIISDWKTYVHMAFVIFISIQMINASSDSAITNGMKTEEFQMANELDAKLIVEFNNNTKEIREYVKLINKHELQSIRDDFLYKYGDLSYEELPVKLKRKYDNLKPVVHNVYGFNIPLNYDVKKSKTINYSVSNGSGKILFKKITKVLSSVLFGVMTIDMVVNFENIGSAMISILIITSGLLITFVSTYVPQYNRYKTKIPNQVLIKNTFMNGYKEWKSAPKVSVSAQNDTYDTF